MSRATEVGHFVVYFTPRFCGLYATGMRQWEHDTGTQDDIR